MAVDTRNKRFSLLGMAVPMLLVLPAPDGSIVQADRQQFAYMYSGVTLDFPVVAELDVVELTLDFTDTVTVTASFTDTVSLTVEL